MRASIFLLFCSIVFGQDSISNSSSPSPSISSSVTIYLKDTSKQSADTSKQPADTPIINNENTITMAAVISLIAIVLIIIVATLVLIKNKPEQGLNSPPWTIHENPIRRRSLSDIHI